MVEKSGVFLNSEDLKKRLSNAEAVTSLASELRVGGYLQNLNWAVSQGSFFVDSVTTKMREIDLVARRLWQSGARMKKLRARLNLIIEVKTMRGYHLVFAPMLDALNNNRVIVEREWIGYASERSTHQTQLVQSLDRVGIGPDEKRTILQQLFDLAYPDGFTVTYDLVPDPPPTPFLSSAFREANVGNSKDLDAAVFWKAAQAVNACVAYGQTYHLEIQREHVELAADYARNRGKPVVDEILEELSDSVRQIELFHSIIVVDAMLWSMDGEEIERLPWCRFCQLSRLGRMAQWYDVVQREFANDYLSEVTRHYDQHMTEAGAELNSLYA